MVATYLDLGFDEGDDFPYVFTMTDENGAAIDLTGSTIYMTCKKRKDDSDSIAIFKKTVTPTVDPELGIFEITLDRADTLNIKSGIYPYDIKFVSAATKTRTLFYGNIKLNQAITDTI